jgi:hypothetical protein
VQLDSCTSPLALRVLPRATRAARHSTAAGSCAQQQELHTAAGTAHSSRNCAQTAAGTPRSSKNICSFLFFSFLFFYFILFYFIYFILFYFILFFLFYFFYFILFYFILFSTLTVASVAARKTRANITPRIPSSAPASRLRRAPLRHVVPPRRDVCRRRGRLAGERGV